MQNPSINVRNRLKKWFDRPLKRTLNMAYFLMSGLNMIKIIYYIHKYMHTLIRLANEFWHFINTKYFSTSNDALKRSSLTHHAANRPFCSFLNPVNHLMPLLRPVQSHIWKSLWKCWLLTVTSVTGPGTWLLCHGEQGVRDIGQKAVQVKHVGLHRRGLRHLVHLIGPFLQLGVADRSLEHTSHFRVKVSKKKKKTFGDI